MRRPDRPAAAGAPAWTAARPLLGGRAASPAHTTHLRARARRAPAPPPPPPGAAPCPSTASASSASVRPPAALGSAVRRGAAAAPAAPAAAHLLRALGTLALLLLPNPLTAPLNPLPVTAVTPGDDEEYVDELTVAKLQVWGGGGGGDKLVGGGGPVP
jgi:hypothetical protein